MRRLVQVAMVSLTLAPGGLRAQTEAQAVTLRIDPRLILEAAEVWALVTGPENPIWPGWDASDTPLLFYLPGEQDVLINHPRPPEGFVAYRGPIQFPRGRIVLRDGATILGADGQNTSRDIAGTRTLVVADALSNLRQEIRGLLTDPRSARDKAQGLGFSQLATDPYRQMMLIVHEAFHVFQDRVAPDRGANEMLLLHYPVLSAQNNVGFAQEGAALAAALRSDADPAFRAAVTRWLALRRHRRAALPAEAVEYENGTEFGEGLATYAEYRLLESLQGRQPRPEMWWVQGFRGYDDLASRRSALVDRMLQHLRGEVSVNNDPYGTAPLRMRLYFSGMAIAAVLDRLAPSWKDRILHPGTSLTDVAAEALGASAADVQRALEEARREPDHAALVAAKERLAREGRARIDTMLTQIERGAGTGITVDYGALATPRVALAFTPFGITVVDSDRTIYTQVPIQAHFADGSEVAQTEEMPLLHDKSGRRIRFRLSRELSADEVVQALGGDTRIGRDVRGLRLELPGVRLSARSATAHWDGRELRIVLTSPQR